MLITPLFAALLTPLYFLLTARVIRYRREHRVEIGDGNQPELLRRMRVHANFTETVPFALLLMAFAELLHAPTLALYLVGTLLLLGRISHAYALSQTPHVMRLRVLGMVCTFGATAMAAVMCLFFSLKAVLH